ncbi:MAG TPA: hypothetical protein VJT84_01150 [Gaiellaceae bacterium]|nr:hypothetical protein [Gaiellaceae bacterium]
MKTLALLALAMGATPTTIWGAVTGFYGTKRWSVIDVCQSADRGDRFALVQARIGGTKHVAALHLLSKRRGWVVMWADGRANPRIDPYTRALVDTEVTRLKAKCLAP